MCVEIQFCTHPRLWDVLFSLNKSKSLSTTGQALWHLYILSPVIFHLTHMYSVEPSSRRLNCTEVETGQRRKAPSPQCIIPFNSFIHGRYRRHFLYRPCMCRHTPRRNLKHPFIIANPCNVQILAFLLQILGKLVGLIWIYRSGEVWRRCVENCDYPTPPHSLPNYITLLR